MEKYYGLFFRVSQNWISGLFFTFYNHSYLVFLKHHLKRTVFFHNYSCVAWILGPVVNLDAWKKQHFFSQMVVFHGDEPHGRKQRITPKTNPSNCSENPWPPKTPKRLKLHIDEKTTIFSPLGWRQPCSQCPPGTSGSTYPCGRNDDPTGSGFPRWSVW